MEEGYQARVAGVAQLIVGHIEVREREVLQARASEAATRPAPTAPI